MRNNEFDKIKISDIANKAGVSRMTYYRNYISKENIIETHVNYIFEMITEEFENNESKSVERFFDIFFDYMEKEKALFINIQCTNLAFSLYDLIVKNCSILFEKHFILFNDNEYYHNYLLAIIGACVGLLYEWSKQKDNQLSDYSVVVKDLISSLKEQMIF